jgi:DNA-binding CsgD family transcriptional regulator
MMRLPARQQEALLLYVEGYSRKQAAAKLFISENTYAWHLRKIRESFGVRTRMEMAELAQKIKQSKCA